MNNILDSFTVVWMSDDLIALHVSYSYGILSINAGWFTLYMWGIRQ